jgi:hypothetical protein
VQDRRQQGQEQPGDRNRGRRIRAGQQEEPDDGHRGQAHAMARADRTGPARSAGGLPDRDEQRVAAEGGHRHGHRQPGEGLEQRQVQA